MKITLTPNPPEYPQVSVDQLAVGQAVRYCAGNCVLRLTRTLYLSVDSNGRDYMVTALGDPIIGHGYGGLMPAGTLLTFKL